MMNRPQTLYGIANSPVDIAAWTFDHDAHSQTLFAHVVDGQPKGLMRDDILDNGTLYWLTNTAIFWLVSIGNARWPSLPRTVSRSLLP
jgi:hypothetical protein